MAPEAGGLLAIQRLLEEQLQTAVSPNTTESRNRDVKLVVKHIAAM